MDGHHPHQVLARPRLALQLALADVEPLDEALQARRMAEAKASAALSSSSIGSFASRPSRATSFLPALPRPDQHPVEQRLRRLVIGAGEQLAELFERIAHTGSAKSGADAPTTAADSRPRRQPWSSRSCWLQPTSGETSRLARLRSSSGCAAKRSAAIRSFTASGAPSRSRSHPRHRHARRMQPRDDQPGQLAALAHQHHDVARPGIAARALFEREALVDPPP